MIFLVKMGAVVHVGNCNKCFKVNRLISFFFYLYYSGIFLLMFFLMFHYIDIILGDNTISLIVTFILYMVLEIVTALIIPLQKTKCKDKGENKGGKS